MFAPTFPSCSCQGRPAGYKDLCALSFGDAWVKAETQNKSLTVLKRVAKLPFTLDCQNDL